MFYAVAC